MILQKLNAYYERVAADRNETIATFGFSVQKASFCVVLEKNGVLHGFQEIGSENQKGKIVPEKIIVPGQAKPTGQITGKSVANKARFLWDNAQFMLGFAPEGTDPELSVLCFQAFRDKHIALEEQIADDQFTSVCRFLEQWDPASVASHEELANITRNFGVFRLRGEKGYVHQREGIDRWWHRQVDPLRGHVKGICLISGEYAPIARVHEPKIKGVADAQSSGALIVSFNEDAFESYGKTKSYNVPVSKLAAFQYATALNHLLGDNRHRVQIGDATTAFWTERPTLAEQIVPSLFAGTTPASAETEDQETLDQIRSFLDSLRQGKADELVGQLGEADTPFYILGLSPNASRISIRYWLVSTIGELCAHLSRYVCDLDIAGLGDRLPTISELLLETAALHDPSKIPKNLSGELFNAILSGRAYPQAFYMAILRRIRSEGFVNRQKRSDWLRAMSVRAAAVKACLIRNFGKEITVTLQEDRPETAYHLGRWFAAMEITQKDALGDNLNSTIKDKFYRAASATPSTAFPRLIPLSNHHMKRIEKPWRQIELQKLIQGIAWKIDDFPRHLKLEDQGLFHLGYYHQTQAFYTKKNAPETPDNESE